MSAFSKPKITQFLATADDAILNDQQRGAALEDLVDYLFSRIPGMRDKQRNVLTSDGDNEVDLAFGNDRHVNGLPTHPPYIQIECKNRCAPASAKDLGWFDYNLIQRSEEFGIFVALRGITGNAHGSAAQQILRNAVIGKRRVIVITRADIETLASTADLCRLIKRRTTEVVTRMGIRGVSGADVKRALRPVRPARVVQLRRRATARRGP